MFSIRNFIAFFFAAVSFYESDSEEVPSGDAVKALGLVPCSLKWSSYELDLGLAITLFRRDVIREEALVGWSMMVSLDLESSQCFESLLLSRNLASTEEIMLRPVCCRLLLLAKRFWLEYLIVDKGICFGFGSGSESVKSNSSCGYSVENLWAINWCTGNGNLWYTCKTSFLALPG